MNLLIAAAVLPAIALLYYVYKKDTVEKEPPRLIIRLFVLGMVAGPLAGITENFAFAAFESILSPGPLLLICEYFIGVAAVEEGFKYLFLNTVRNSPEFNYVFDGIVYAVAVAVGFAALENILYVFDGGFEVAVQRAIFAVPGHFADGVIMGCFFGLAKQREVRGNKAGAHMYYVLAFLLPTIEHGFYDAALSSESDLLALIALALDLAFIAIAIALIRRMSKNDSPLHHPNQIRAAQTTPLTPMDAQSQMNQYGQTPQQPTQPYGYGQQYGQQNPWQHGTAQRQAPTQWQQPSQQQPWDSDSQH